MPVLPPSGPGPLVVSGGMSRQDIIELVNVATERKFEKFDTTLLRAFSIILQDFCGRNRYWWRKGNVSFQTVQGQATYDLSQITTNPVLTEIAVEEVTQIALVSGTNGNPPLTPLTPVFDDEALNEMIAGFNQNGATNQVAPARYTFDANDYKVIRIDAPDGVYTLQMSFWAMPNPSIDTTNPSVPVVPPWHHKAIVAGLEAWVWKRIYGPTNPKYLTAKEEYENYIFLAQARPRFTTNYAQTLTQSESAIQSTS